MGRIRRVLHYWRVLLRPARSRPRPARRQNRSHQPDYIRRTVDGGECLGNAFQNRHRRRMSLRVAQADQHRSPTARLRQLLPRLVQDHERLAALLAPDLHILPAKLRADPRAECLRDGLLRREPRRQEWRRRFVRQAISDFVRMQNPIQKALAKAFVRSLNPRHLDNVNADAENHRSPESKVRSPKSNCPFSRLRTQDSELTPDTPPSPAAFLSPPPP